jgi:hypothetical protein
MAFGGLILVNIARAAAHYFSPAIAACAGSMSGKATAA